MERPIIFSSKSVRAILDDRKTQTRRVIKPQPIHVYLSYSGRYHFDGAMAKDQLQVGDRLWVRETWAAQFIYDDYPPRGIPIDSVVFYRTNDRLKLEIAKEHRDLGKWRPSIFMPRWASRITLEITEVRVERVQAITLSDIHREGLDNLAYTDEKAYGFLFKKQWDSLNAKRGYGWDTNPWVWVINIKCDNI